MAGRKPRTGVRPPQKLKLLVDHDASGTAGAITSMGWKAYPANPRATDQENVKEATQKGLSILSMDTDYQRFGLREIPFTVILQGGAQQSMSTATAQIQQLHRLIRIGEISPAVHQRVTVTTVEAKVETLAGNAPALRRIPLRLGQKRKRR